MFRDRSPGLHIAVGFPRIRGDVPAHAGEGRFELLFSPHTRGCSDLFDAGFNTTKVFPAYAGMFLWLSRWCCFVAGFPRIRGDVPNHERRTVAVPRFSPHTRGCSDAECHQIMEQAVFPAYAGMFLLGSGRKARIKSFPRIRGDVPRLISGLRSGRRVFPAYAGMFRRLGGKRGIRQCFPRIRGDVPRWSTVSCLA